nr:MAG TPA: hypothetical protein [Caudoviricetes sp.]
MKWERCPPGVFRGGWVYYTSYFWNCTSKYFAKVRPFYDL